MKVKHGNWKMISSLVNDILGDVVGDKDVIEEDAREEEAREETSSDEEKDLSPYEKIRNNRVRQIQAEFNRRYPNFEEEVRQLKARKMRRSRGGRKTPLEVSTPRRSLRGVAVAGSGQQEIVSFQTNVGCQVQSSSLDFGLINGQEEAVEDQPCNSGQSDLSGVQLGLTGDPPGNLVDEPGIPDNQHSMFDLCVDQPSLSGDQHGLSSRPQDQGQVEALDDDPCFRDPPDLPGDQPDLSGDQAGLSGECDHLGEEQSLRGLPGGDLVERDLPGDQHVQLGFQNQSYGIADHHNAETEDEEVRDAGNLELGFLGKYGCVPCGMKFRDRGNLKRHVKQMHEVRSTPVICPRTWCQAEFSILANMMKHKETCFLVCPYPGCQKTFRMESRFSAHQRAHLVMTRRMSD